MNQVGGALYISCTFLFLLNIFYPKDFSNVPLPPKVNEEYEKKFLLEKIKELPTKMETMDPIDHSESGGIIFLESLEK